MGGMMKGFEVLNTLGGGEVRGTGSAPDRHQHIVYTYTAELYYYS